MKTLLYWKSAYYYLFYWNHIKIFLKVSIFFQVSIIDQKKNHLEKFRQNCVFTVTESAWFSYSSALFCTFSTFIYKETQQNLKSKTPHKGWWWPLFLQQWCNGWVSVLLLLHLEFEWKRHDKQHKNGLILQANNCRNHTNCDELFNIPSCTYTLAA